MTKIIKEMLPPDVRVARDAQDLLIECCVGELYLKFSSFFLTNFSCFVIIIILVLLIYMIVLPLFLSSLSRV